MGDMFQQPILEVENPAVFGPVKAAVEAAFAPPSVARFLDNAERARLRSDQVVLTPAAAALLAGSGAPRTARSAPASGSGTRTAPGTLSRGTIQARARKQKRR